MKFNKFMIYGMIFLAVLTLGAVNAADNSTADDLAVTYDSGDFDTSLQNDEIVEDISCDDTLAKDADEGISEISADNSESADLALIPVALDVNVVDNSRVDINAGNVTGNVIVIVDDSENTVALNNDSSASFPLKSLSAGNHTLVVIYEGDDTHDSAHMTSVFSIPAKAASEFSDIVIGDDFAVTMTLKDEMGNAIANVPVKYGVNGDYTNAKTNAKGILAFSGKAGAVVSVMFDGNDKFAAANTTVTFNVPVTPSAKVVTRFNIPNGAITVNGYAVDTKAGEEGIYFTTKLLDANGNPVKGVPVRLVINNNIYSAVTLDDGSFAPFKVNMAKAGKYTMALFFDGNSQYSSAFASVCFNLAKKTIKIKASAKKFKASATKKYTVKLSTIVGSSHDGKAHLSSKKVTLKIKGKTYTAKTKSNGKATFKLKITKKGKYTAKIKFPGDNTYKSKTKSVKITIK